MRALRTWVTLAAVCAAGAAVAAEKRITFTGCVRQGKACLLLGSADGKLTYALIRDLKGRIEPGKAYRVAGTLSEAKPCDNVAGSIDPKKAEPVTLECPASEPPTPGSSPQ